ncbi:MAG: gluconokinase [Chloroflexi bacterium]|nr:gluconokinase [Chloroflexota bacterium]
MGVSGSGKTTVGTALAEAVGWPFHDADDYHPPENVEKMTEGRPLTDSDRWPWLDRLRDLIVGAPGPLVLACSALKASYRDRLTPPGARVEFVYLRGSFSAIAARMRQREHFMPPGLLRSQFDALEEPTNALIVPVEMPVGEAVTAIREGLHLF